MPLYFFRISHGRYAGASDEPQEFEKVGGISRCLKQNADWQMELLDEAKEPVFRIRLVAESFG